MSPLIIYHGKCADGFTAAWIAKKSLDEEIPEAPAELMPAVYGDEPPECDGRLVYVLDFSYNKAGMEYLCAHARLVIWLDHHATAIAECGDLLQDRKLVGIARVDRSGAWLTWEWFHGATEVPDIVKLVDDRDRWVFADPRSRFFAHGLFSRLYTMEDWDAAASDIQGTVDAGVAIDNKHWKDIRESLDVATVHKVIDGSNVPTANLMYMSASDACHELLHRFPGAKFAATWFLRSDGKNVYSLRSRTGSDVDVGVIAKKFGGGGHKHAAGFAIDAQVDKGVLTP
jgi:oligoribonuclease NrnB/cAMP/cGMP phosphodiesterase (DHH superfamily)